MTARAPRARARTTSAPRRTPPSSSTSLGCRPRPPLGEGLDGRARSVELPPAVVRHDQAVDAVLDRLSGVRGSHHALQEQRAGPEGAEPREVGPGHRRVDLAVGHARQGDDVGSRGAGRADEVGQGQAGPKSTRRTQPSRSSVSRTFRSVTRGGMVKPFRMSRSRVRSPGRRRSGPGPGSRRPGPARRRSGSGRGSARRRAGTTAARAPPPPPPRSSSSSGC